MKRPKRKSAAEIQAECIVWNHKHPVGTPVIYHPVIGEKDGGIETKTTSEAYVLGDHTPVVLVEAIRGCVALEACEPFLPALRKAAGAQ